MHNHRNSNSLVVVVVLLLFGVGCFEGKDLYVVNGEQNGDGSLEKPFGDISSAFNLAESGDVILITPDHGSYKGTKNSGMIMTSTTILNISFFSSSIEPVIVDLYESDEPFLRTEKNSFRPYTAAFKEITFKGKKNGNIIEFSGNLNMINANFSNNDVKDGHCLYTSESVLELTNCYFSKNGVNTNGPSLYLKNTEAIISHTVFNNHSSSSEVQGGVAYITGKLQRVLFEDCHFSRNEGASSGGAIYLNQGTVSLSNSEFIHNKAVNGAAIFSEESILEAKESKFLYNTANNGGTIQFFGDDNAVFTDCHLQENDGSAFVVDGKANVEILNSYFGFNNESVDGGAIEVLGTATVSLNQVELEKNVAGNNGGAIFAAKGATVSIINSTLRANVAENGGALAVFGELYTSKQTYFMRNIARTSGGAIYLGASSTISQSIFEENKAQDNGGAIFSDIDGNVKIFACNFTQNGAQFGGAAVGFSGNVTGEIEDSLFNHTQITKETKACIYLTQSKVFTINNVKFENFDHYYQQHYSLIKVYATGKASGPVIFNNVNFVESEGSDVYISEGRTAVIDQPIDGAFCAENRSAISLCGANFNSDNYRNFEKIQVYLKGNSTLYASDDILMDEIFSTNGNVLVGASNVSSCLLGADTYKSYNEKTLSFQVRSVDVGLLEDGILHTDITHWKGTEAWNSRTSLVDGAQFYFHSPGSTLDMRLTMNQNSSLGDPDNNAFTYICERDAIFYFGNATIYGDFQANNGEIEFMYKPKQVYEVFSLPNNVKKEFIWYNSTIIGTTYDDNRNYDATLMKYEKRGGTTTKSIHERDHFKAGEHELTITVGPGGSGLGIGLGLGAFFLVLVVVCGGVYWWRKKKRANPTVI